MKRWTLVLMGLSLITYFGCGKSAPSTAACTNALPYSESADLLKFADDSIHATFDSSGIYYEIVDSGLASAKPSLSSYMYVNYIGKLMNNTIFDSATHSPLGGYQLQQLIPAWQFGLTKIGVGGRIRLLIPSAYAYGCNGYLTIPPNSPLYFDITLLSIY
jgi:FKBP-type peptidyl-prolyl cis-trans isomerase FkpA